MTGRCLQTSPSPQSNKTRFLKNSNVKLFSIKFFQQQIYLDLTSISAGGPNWSLLIYQIKAPNSWPRLFEEFIFTRFCTPCGVNSREINICRFEFSPIGSMHGIYLPTFTKKNKPNVGIYIHHTWMLWVFEHFKMLKQFQFYHSLGLRGLGAFPFGK